MNIETVLNVVENLRATLERWGVTTEFLVACALIASFLFFLSLREVLVWYPKIPQMRAEMRAMRAQIAELQWTLNKMREELPKEVEAPAGLAPKEEPKAPSRNFQFDH